MNVLNIEDAGFRECCHAASVGLMWNARQQTDPQIMMRYSSAAVCAELYVDGLEGMIRNKALASFDCFTRLCEFLADVSLEHVDAGMDSIVESVRRGSPSPNFKAVAASCLCRECQRHSISVGCEIATTVSKEIEKVFSRRSDNHFNDLEAALARMGISMEFTEGKEDLAFSKGGQTVTGAQMNRPLRELVAMSQRAGRKVSAEQLRDMAARERAKLAMEDADKKVKGSNAFPRRPVF